MRSEREYGRTKFCSEVLSAQQSVGDCLLATVLEGPDQGRQLLLGGGQLLWPSAPSALLVRGMDALGSTQSPDICILEGVRVFVQPLTAPVRLVVCGGGHVAQAVVRLAQVLGLPVCALEDRPEFAAALEQAGAAQVLLGSYAENLSRLPGSKGDCYVVLTRGHRYDLDCLTQILQKPLSYVGVMASRRRAELLRSQLRESGAAPEQVAALHSPVGLADRSGNSAGNCAVHLGADRSVQKQHAKPRGFYTVDAENNDRQNGLGPGNGGGPAGVGTSEPWRKNAGRPGWSAGRQCGRWYFGV